MQAATSTEQVQSLVDRIVGCEGKKARQGDAGALSRMEGDAVGSQRCLPRQGVLRVTQPQEVGSSDFAQLFGAQQGQIIKVRQSAGCLGRIGKSVVAGALPEGGDGLIDLTVQAVDRVVEQLGVALLFDRRQDVSLGVQQGQPLGIRLSDGAEFVQCYVQQAACLQVDRWLGQLVDMPGPVGRVGIT